MTGYIEKQLGSRIRELRKTQGFSQEAFAEEIGVATNTLSSIERGNAFMTASTLEKIIDILNIQPQELFNFSTCKTNKDLYDSIISKINNIKNNNERLTILLKLIDALL